MTAMNPDAMLGRVRSSLDILIAAAERHGGLFPSVIDPKTRGMPLIAPEPIKGQRSGDRSFPGNNLMHDEPTLRTLYALSSLIDRPEYAAAADAYLRRFATHCTDTPNGLFPWGEHAFWDLVEDRLNPGAIHDHLRQAPAWLWEKLWEINPRCVERFAEGLECHWTEGEPEEYSRHAPMDSRRPAERHGSRSCDFPRHCGFYIFDLTFAWLKTRRPEFHAHIRRLLDYWWHKRFEDGLLLSESRSPDGLRPFKDVKGPGQTLSLGVSLLESAELVGDADTGLARTMRERGLTYVDGFLNAPHDLSRGVYILGFNHVTGEVINDMPVWGSIYGIWPACYVALVCACGYRLTGDAGLLEWAESVGQRYVQEPLPDDIAVPSMDAGLALGLLVDLYRISGTERWLDGALALASRLVEVYLDGDLICGAAGIDWYESQMGPGFLLHGLASVALAAEHGASGAMEADYTAR